MNDIPDHLNPFSDKLDQDAWMALDIDERRRIYAEVQAMIMSEAPFICQPVFASGDHDYHFVYTIGRWRAGLPEVIMTGNKSWGCNVFARLHDDGILPSKPGVFTLGPGSREFRIAAILVDPAHWDNFGMALAHGYNPLVFPPLQITLESDEGFMLWEPEHYAYQDPTMPMLGPAPVDISLKSDGGGGDHSG